jgi:hypothetical protein
MKKQLTILALMALAAVKTAYADDITLITAYPVGGGTYRVTEALKSGLETAGNTVTYKNFKFCTDAINYLASSGKNTFMSVYDGDIFLDGTTATEKCPIIDKKLNIGVYSGVISTPYYLITNPGLKVSTFDELKILSKTQKIKIGMYYAPISVRIAKLLGEHNLTNYVVVEYNTAGELRAAIAAGDVDVVMASTQATEIVSKGGVIIGTNTKYAVTDKIPYLGDPEYLPGVSMVTVNGTITPEVDKSMKMALNSLPLVALSKTMSGKLNSITTGLTVEKSLARLEQMKTIINSK